nr:hypothetical protein [Tanacetum cinerariifolium]
NPDDPMSTSIEDDDHDSERDIPILEKFLDNYSLSLNDNESYHFDIPSPYRPPAKPPDGKIGTLNIKMMGDVSDQKVSIPGLTISRISNKEKSPDLLSHQGLEVFQPSAEVFNTRRQEMEETFHVTFYVSISQTSTEGDAINFNEVNSFLDDEFKPIITSLPIIFSTLEDSSIPNIKVVVLALDEAIYPKPAATFESTDLQKDDSDEPIDDHPLL